MREFWVTFVTQIPKIGKFYYPSPRKSCTKVTQIPTKCDRKFLVKKPKSNCILKSHVKLVYLYTEFTLI